MLRVLLPLLILAGASEAGARNWPTTAGWDISQIESGCGMSMIYEGPGETELTLLLGADGSNALGILNYNWSAQDSQSYPLTYILNGQAYEGGTSRGYHSGLKKGFLTRFEPSFVAAFAAGETLSVYNGDVLIDRLSLRGTAAALAVARRCLAVVRAEQAAAERERARWAYLPRDPFAGANVGAASPSSPASPPEPSRARANLPSYVSDADYPASAVANREEGTVEFELTVGADGRVSSCAVTSSSGSETLDQATCRIMRSRARFTPAHGGDGRPTTDTVRSRIRWSLPSE